MRRIGLPAAAAAMALLLTACGGESGAEDDGTTTTTTDSSVTTTAAAADTTTAAGTDTTESTTSTTAGGDNSGSGDTSGLPDMSGGSASFTLAGETEEFDWFVCFFGDAVALLEEDEDLTFLAVGRRGGSFPSMEGVEAQIIVSQGESDFSGTQFTVLYILVGSDGAQTLWDYIYSEDVDEELGVEIDGGRVTFDGDMEQFIGNQPTDEIASGSLEATCSPNSVGS